MHLCACAAASAAIKNKHSFSLFPFCIIRSTPPNVRARTHTCTHLYIYNSLPFPVFWKQSSSTFLFFLLLLQSPPIATRSFMCPLGGGGNVREAHFSPAGADRSTPPNEKGKGVIVKHVSLQCQNTTRAQ